MNREIKFRSWNNAQSKMLNSVGVHPSLTSDLSVEDDYYETNEDGRYIVDSSNDNYKLMQYTGLKDKNGKEIYEGDIVKAIIERMEFVTEVVFGKKSYGWSLKCDRTDREKWGKLKYYKLPSSKYIEVIGNIYSNTEML